MSFENIFDNCKSYFVRKYFSTHFSSEKRLVITLEMLPKSTVRCANVTKFYIHFRNAFLSERMTSMGKGIFKAGQIKKMVEHFKIFRYDICDRVQFDKKEHKNSRKHIL